MDVWTKIEQTVGQSKSIEDQTLWVKSLFSLFANTQECSFEQTFLAGVASESSSSAFWAGYQVAIQRLFGPQLKDEIASFVVNEKKSFKPKNWSTSLVQTEGSDELLLSGNKDFVTAVDQIDVLLIGANTVELSNESNTVGHSKVCKLGVEVEGLSFFEFSGLPVFKELKKSRVEIKTTEVHADSIFVGDGYDNYIKPFRIIEDFYITSVLLGYVIRLLLQSDNRVDDAFDLMVVIEDLKTSEKELLVGMPQCKSSSLLFETTLRNVSDLILKTVQKHESEEGFSNLRKDLMILKIGEKARSIRYDRALKASIES